MDLFEQGEIVPGRRVGQFQLGTPWSDLKDQLMLHDEVEQLSGSFVAKLPSMWFFIDTATQQLKQITVLNRFRGTVGGVVGLGSIGRHVAATLGAWQEDEEDNLVVPAYPGVCFGVTYVPGHDVEWHLLHAPIESISVYRP